MSDTITNKLILEASFFVDKNLEEVKCVNGETVGFKLPDGRTVRPVVALEVESEDGMFFDYLTAESDMSNTGVELVDYIESRFEE